MIGEIGLTYEDAIRAVEDLTINMRNRESPTRCIALASDEHQTFTSFLVGFFLGISLALRNPYEAHEFVVLMSKAISGDRSAIEKIVKELDID